MGGKTTKKSIAIKTERFLFFSAVLGMLSACGGGGGASSVIPSSADRSSEDSSSSMSSSEEIDMAKYPNFVKDYQNLAYSFGDKEKISEY